MRQLLAVLLFCAGIFCLAQTQAQVPMTGAGLGAPGGAAPPAYTGPGDIVSSAKAFWATSSCYNAAYSGNVALVIDNATGLLTTTLGCTAGVVSVTAGNPLATTCSGTCNYKTLYDQSGANACAGATACDITEAGPTQMTLNANALNSTSCASFMSGLSLISANNFTLTQPFSVVMVSERTGGTSNIFAVVRDSGSAAGTIRAGYNNSANTAGMYTSNNVVAGATASDNAFHSLVHEFADATQSIIYVDGSGTNQTLGGTGGFAGTAGVALGSSNAGETGFVCEAGIWPSAISSGNASSLSSNARMRYGSF